MLSIDMNSITNKIKDYKRSDEGKKRITQTIDDYVKNGVKRTAAGSYILTSERMNDIADMLIYELKQTASKYFYSGDIPDDILSLFDELYHSEPEKIGGIKGLEGAIYYSIDVSFVIKYSAEGWPSGLRHWS